MGVALNGFFNNCRIFVFVCMSNILKWGLYPIFYLQDENLTDAMQPVDKMLDLEPNRLDDEDDVVVRDVR